MYEYSRIQRQKNAPFVGVNKGRWGLRLSMILFLLLVDRSSRGLAGKFLLLCCYFYSVVDKDNADAVPTFRLIFK